jgi:hypothetical protein
MASILGVIVSLLILLSAATMPSSIVLLEKRKGRFQAWAMMAVFGALCFALGGQEFAAWMLSAFVIPGMGLSMGFRRSARANWIFLLGFGLAVFCMLSIDAIAAVGMNLTAGDLHVLYRTMKASFQEIFANYGVNQESLKQLPGGADKFFKYALLLSPSISIAMEAILVWLNLLLVLRFAPEGSVRLATRDLSGWSAPEGLVFGVLVPAVAIMLWPRVWVYAAAGNLVIVFMVPFFFQGMAITSHTLRRMKLGPGMRFAAYTLLVGIFGGMVVPAQAAIGILDIWLDFRRLRSPVKPETREPQDEEGDSE